MLLVDFSDGYRVPAKKLNGPGFIRLTLEQLLVIRECDLQAALKSGLTIDEFKSLLGPRFQ